MRHPTPKHAKGIGLFFDLFDGADLRDMLYAVLMAMATFFDPSPFRRSLAVMVRL